MKVSKEKFGGWQEVLVGGKFRQETGGLETNRIEGWWMRVVVVGVGLFLSGRLMQLQIVEGSYHRQRSEENRILSRRLAAPRGIVFDRNGIALVRNVPDYKKEVRNDLGEVEFVQISREEALSLSGKESGERVFFDVGREYLLGEEMAHLLGYVAEISGDELTDCGWGECYLGQLVGKMGVEKYYGLVIQGQSGSELLEVDARGELLRMVGKKESVAGMDLTLAADAKLQQKLVELLEGRKGAVVATDPKTGEVLALVSSPGFNPNVFREQLTTNNEKEIERLLTSEDKPFFNRALGGGFPPGSVFKVVTSIAGLETGVVDADFEVEDTGEIRIDEYRYGNWYFDQYGKTEGLVNMVKGIKRSNDIYFYKVGEKVGPTQLAEWARYFGLGQKTEIDLPGEIEGLVPDPEWKEKFKGERWFLGNTYHFAIGQGDLVTTPLQINQMTGVVANGGRWCRPTVVKVDENQVPSGKVNCHELGIKQTNLDTVIEGMKEACSEKGTAFPFFNFSPQVACKTGTAQHGNDKTPHAWFTVFAPIDNPEIVMTVMLEEAGEGSAEAAPVAKKALEYWFNEK